MMTDFEPNAIWFRPAINHHGQHSATCASAYQVQLSSFSCVRLLVAFVMILGVGCGAQNAQYQHNSSVTDYRSRVQEESLGRRELTSARPIGPSRIVTASWYGPGYEGHRTASGERFNRKRLSAASTTLPLGTLVRVTNLENGRSADVTINDRGPGVRGRSLDLTPAAARKIGLNKSGVARVKVTPISAK
jgi:rare lipoprotein A (peptidoglycan hydrolase)